MIDRAFTALFVLLGAYGTLFHIGSKVLRNKLLSDYDYILLIDTEGLLSIEKGDEQYDKRLILFCLAISHLVIVNIAGEINEALKQILILCTQSLKHIEVARVTQPVVHFVLNQKADPNLLNCQKQVNVIRDDLIRNGLKDVIDLGESNFHVLSTAFNREPFSVGNYECAALSTDIKFVNDVQKLCEHIVGSSFGSIGKSDSDFSNPMKWMVFADTVFQIVKLYPDLTYFKDIYERKQNQAIRQEIRKDLEKNCSTKKGQELIEREKENSFDQIQQAFKIEQEKTLKKLESNLEKRLGQYAVSAHIRKRWIRFLEVQVACRFRSWEASTIMARERYQLDKIARDCEDELRKLVFRTAGGGQVLDRDSALIRFERIWTDRFTRIEGGFDSLKQWKQSIELVCRLSDVLDQDSLPSASHILDYLPFLQSLDQSQSDDMFRKNLTKICTGCQSQASNINPLAPKSADENRTIQQSDLLKIYQFLNNDQLATIAVVAGKKMERVRRETKPDKVINYSQEISSRSQTILQLSHCFDLLKTSMNTCFQSKMNSEHSTEITLVQDILGEVDQLIKDINQELNVFNLTVSKSLQSILYTCAALSTAWFYYYRHQTHFAKLILSINQTKPKWQARFLRLIGIEKNDDAELATNLAKELSEALREIYDQKASAIRENYSDNGVKNFDRLSIMTELDKEVYQADEGWLMDYVLSPTKIIIDRFKQIWIKVDLEMREELQKAAGTHFELLSEFFRRIKLIQDDFKSNNHHPLTFIDDLFQSSSQISETISAKKQSAMTILIYRYLLEEWIPEEITINDGSIYQIQNEWRERINSKSRQNDLLKDLITKMKDTFASNTIIYIDVFLERILGNEKETNQTLQNHTANSTDNSCRSTYNQICDRLRGCQVKCPCCKRLCDVDHQLNSGIPVGQEENRHQCQSGHQIRGMGGVRYQVTNEASIVWCENIGDYDPVVDQHRRRQTWRDFKKSHADWDFGDPKTRETKQTPYIHIWKKIGRRLCEHFGKGMEFVEENSPIPVNHFILLLDHSGSMNGTSKSLKRMLRLITAGNTTTEASKPDEKTMTPWEHLLKAVKNFIDIRIDKICHTDRMTIIIFGNTATRICYQETVNTIDMENIDISMDICGEGTNFSAPFRLLIDTLNEMKNDSTYNNLRNTIIFLTDGEPQNHCNDELDALSSGYQPMITRFWTMGLGKYNEKILREINEKMHGEFRNIEHPADLIERYAEIADFCDENLP